MDESAGIVHLKEGKSKARWRIFSLFRGLPISAVEEEGEEEGSGAERSLCAASVNFTQTETKKKRKKAEN